MFPKEGGVVLLPSKLFGVSSNSSNNNDCSVALSRTYHKMRRLAPVRGGVASPEEDAPRTAETHQLLNLVGRAGVTRIAPATPP